MHNGQEEHLARLIRMTTERMDAKYRSGAREHGGNLYDHSTLTLIENAIDEAIDQCTYLMTIRDQILAQKGLSPIKL